MRAAIIGKGIVGEATGDAFADLGHQVVYYDPPKSIGKKSDLAKVDAVFICVPTPYGDYTAIDTAIKDCMVCDDGTPIVIRSTVPPGFTAKTQKEMAKWPVFFNPEFLTAETARRDARYPARQIMGYVDEATKAIAKRLVADLPRAHESFVIPATAAEVVKLYANAFFALKVTFANQMYDLTTAHGVDHSVVRKVVSYDPMVAPFHLDVWHKGYRGFGGNCLPKDLKVLIRAFEDRQVDGTLLRAVRDYNDSLLNEES